MELSNSTYTLSKHGGEADDYQARKKCKTSNMLILAASQGAPITANDPISGNHIGAYELKEHVKIILENTEKSVIDTGFFFKF